MPPAQADFGIVDYHCHQVPAVRADCRATALAERAECLVIAGVQKPAHIRTSTERGPRSRLSTIRIRAAAVVDHAIALIHRSLPLAAALQGCIQRLFQACCRDLDLS